MPDSGFIEHSKPVARRQLVDERGVFEALENPDAVEGAKEIHKAMGGGHPDEELKRQLVEASDEAARRASSNVPPDYYEE